MSPPGVVVYLQSVAALAQKFADDRAEFPDLGNVCVRSPSLPFPAIMPPDSSADFDVHLERSLRDLKDLREDLSTDVFIFYDKRDVPNSDEEHKKVSPRKIYLDLVERGYKWYVIGRCSCEPNQTGATQLKSGILSLCLTKELHFSWYPDNPNEVDLQQISITMRDAKVRSSFRFFPSLQLSHF